MLSIRYMYVRTVLAVFVLAFLAAAAFLAQNTAAVIILLLLAVATAMSWIVPPGIFGWLIQGACPHCNGHVIWEIRQPEPFDEVIVVRCERCGRSEIEFAYQPR